MSSADSYSGLKDMISGVGDGDRSFSIWLLEWGNSPSAPMLWAILGYICSFFLPMFLFLDEGKGVGDVGPIRLMMMVLSSVVAAAAYHVGFVLRHHKLMREKPPMLGLMMGTCICCCIYIVLGATFMEEGSWPTVIGLELLAIAVFVLLEMARPTVDFFLLRFFVCLPVIAGGRRHGWDFVLLGWPMILFAVISLLWREFMLEYHSPQF